MQPLNETIRIPVARPFRFVNAALLELLRRLGPDDWSRPTVHPDRDVKDLAAHLLHGSIRRVSTIRDGYRPPLPRLETFEEIVAFIQRDNREFITAMRRVSPQILVELIALYDGELLPLLEGLDPRKPGLGVVWAGELVSQSWFDVAREYTEKWHHQQQLRDATGHPPLYEPALLAPVLETFARGLPHAYRDLGRPAGARIAISITGPVQLGWTLERQADRWSLWSGTDSRVATLITLSADDAWRLWTRGLAPEMARPRVCIDGNPADLEPLLRFVAIMA